MVKAVLRWIFGDADSLGSLLQGIAAILIAIAAFVGLKETSEVLTKLLNIQKTSESIEVTSKEIKSAVGILNKQSLYIASIVEGLNKNIRMNQARRAIESSAILKNENSSKSQLNETVKEFTKKINDTSSAVYIPPAKADEVVEKLYNAKTASQRERILEDSFKVKEPFNLDSSMLDEGQL